MPPQTVRTEYLETATAHLGNPAYQCLDLDPLSEAAPLVGDNERMPDAHGRRRFRRHRDQLEVTIAVLVNGAVNDDGTPNADPRQGKRDHLAYLATAFNQAGDSDQSAVLTTWHQPDGTELEAIVQWAGPFGIRRLGPFTVVTTFDLTVPAGVWEEAAP
jgi:hypothetical protein